MLYTSYEMQYYRHPLRSHNLRKTQAKTTIYQDEIDDELKHRLNLLLYKIEKELER